MMNAMDIDFSLIGIRIREVRTLRGLTSEQLSETVDLSSESLRHIEIGASKPSLKKLYAIAEALDVSLDYLTGRVPDYREAITSDYAKDLNLDEKQTELLNDLVSGMIPIITKHL